MPLVLGLLYSNTTLFSVHPRGSPTEGVTEETKSDKEIMDVDQQEIIQSLNGRDRWLVMKMLKCKAYMLRDRKRTCVQ